MKGILLTATSAILLSLSVGNTLAKGDDKAAVESLNHLTYHFALLKEGFNPQDVKKTMSDRLVLKRVPQSFIPLYKTFFKLTDELGENFRRINNERDRISRQNTPKLSEQVNSTISLGSKIMAASADPTGMSGLSLLASLLGQADDNQNITESETLAAYQAQNNQLLTDYEFELRMSQQFVPDIVTDAHILTVTDAREFIGLQRQNDKQAYSELLKLRTRSQLLTQLVIAIAHYELAQKDYDSAVNNLEFALSTLPGILNNQETEADIFEKIILASIANKNNGESIEKYGGLLLQLEPVNPIGLFVLGIQMLGENDPKSGKALLTKSNHYNENIPFIAAINTRVICGIAVDDDCVVAIEKAEALGITDYSEVFSKEVKAKLKQNEAETFHRIFGLRYKLVMDWHIINPDQLLITNITNYKWTGVVAGNTYNEFGGKTFRPFENYWYSFGDLLPGQTLTLKVANSTKKALQQLTIELWTEQGNVRINLLNKGKGVFAQNAKHNVVSKTW